MRGLPPRTATPRSAQPKGATTMNRRNALAFVALALVAFAPAVQAGGRPIPMQEIIDAPFPWPTGKPATMDQAQRAVMAGLAAKGWVGSVAAPGKAHGLLHRDDWTCEIDVTFDTKSYSIRYADSKNLDYDATKKVIHRNFNRWLQFLQEQINLAAQNGT